MGIVEVPDRLFILRGACSRRMKTVSQRVGELMPKRRQNIKVPPRSCFTASVCFTWISRSDHRSQIPERTRLLRSRIN